MDVLRGVSPQAARLMDWWQERRNATGGIPRRSALSPKELVTVLPYLALWEYGAHDSLKLRLMGTHIDHWMGGALPPGTDLFDLIPDADDLALTRAHYDAMRRHACGARLIRDGMRTNGERVRFTTIELPLSRDENRDVAYLAWVACFDTDLPPLASLETPPVAAHTSWQFAHIHYADLGYGRPESSPL